MSNPYCDHLDIDEPSLEAAMHHAEANTYVRFLVCLLERGGRMTLEEVAERFAKAGLGTVEKSLSALKRCRPGRLPAYRTGDQYGLDLYHWELGMWLFRLGFRKSRGSSLKLLPPLRDPLPGPEVALAEADLDEAFRGAWLVQWSAQRLVLAVLDAATEPMSPADVVAALDRRVDGHSLQVDQPTFRNKNSAVSVREDGRWELRPEHEALQVMRVVVRKMIEKAREYKDAQPTTAVRMANMDNAKKREREKGALLNGLRRVLVRSFPPANPSCVVLCDVQTRQIECFSADDLAAVRERLADFDLIAGHEVREVLRGLGFDDLMVRVTEVGLSQKTIKVEETGFVVKLTMAKMVKDTCGIGDAFGDPKRMRAQVAKGALDSLRLRLVKDLKSLFFLYQYGRLHGYVRTQWRQYRETLRAYWVEYEELSLSADLKRAYDARHCVEVVLDEAPDWDEPWATARVLRVGAVDQNCGLEYCVADDDGFRIDMERLQALRVLDGASQPE